MQFVYLLWGFVRPNAAKDYSAGYDSGPYTCRTGQFVDLEATLVSSIGMASHPVLAMAVILAVQNVADRRLTGTFLICSI
jgi:hypothetical protein